MTKFFVFLAMLFVASSIFASEKSLYNFSWLDKDKEIYVLQNRKFRKDGKLFIGGTGVHTLSGPFIDSNGVTLRGGYFFSEDWGVELTYGKAFGNENDTAKGVRVQGTTPFYRKVDTYMGAMAVWSPFYSKINTFNRIFYFDWMLGAGLASVNTLDNRARFSTNTGNKGELEAESSLGAMWNSGLRFYISETWSLRLDITGLHYRADNIRELQGAASTSKTVKMFSHYDLGVGLNYTF